MNGFGVATFGSGTFGDPADVIALSFTDTATVTDTARSRYRRVLLDTAAVTDTAVSRYRRVLLDTTGAADTTSDHARHLLVDAAGSSDQTLRAILRVVIEQAGTSDSVKLRRAQRLVEAADSAGADDATILVWQRRHIDSAGAIDTATLVWHRQRGIVDEAGPHDAVMHGWQRLRSFADRAGARDTLSFNEVPAVVSVFTAWAGTELGSDRIVVRDAPLIVDPRHGNRERDWNQASAVVVDRCSVQPFGATEVAADREFTSTHVRLFAPPNVELSATSRVIFDGATYEVDGEPARWRDLDGRPSHVEAALKRLAG
jgi:hypothetical protein